MTHASDGLHTLVGLLQHTDPDICQQAAASTQPDAGNDRLRKCELCTCVACSCLVRGLTKPLLDAR
jgi:hypothetical protein